MTRLTESDIMIIGNILYQDPKEHIENMILTKVLLTSPIHI